MDNQEQQSLWKSTSISIHFIGAGLHKFHKYLIKYSCKICTLFYFRHKTVMFIQTHSMITKGLIF